MPKVYVQPQNSGVPPFYTGPAGDVLAKEGGGRHMNKLDDLVSHGWHQYGGQEVKMGTMGSSMMEMDAPMAPMRPTTPRTPSSRRGSPPSSNPRSRRFQEKNFMGQDTVIMHTNPMAQGSPMTRSWMDDLDGYSAQNSLVRSNTFNSMTQGYTIAVPMQSTPSSSNSSFSGPPTPDGLERPSTAMSAFGRTGRMTSSGGPERPSTPTRKPKTFSQSASIMAFIWEKQGKMGGEVTLA